MERIPEMTIYFPLHGYRSNHWLILRFPNPLQRINTIWSNLDWRELSGNLCDSKLQIFCAQRFQLQNYFHAQIFEIIVASKVLALTFLCTMLHQSPIIDNRHPSDEVKDVAVACTVSLWDYGSDESLMAVSCAAHAHSYIEENKYFLHSYIRTYWQPSPVLRTRVHTLDKIIILCIHTYRHNHHVLFLLFRRAQRIVLLMWPIFVVDTFGFLEVWMNYFST